jgi:ABC-2 type transport system ATP-binding protein
VEVNVKDGPKVVTEALRILEAEGITPTTLALREPSLDDVFLSITGHRAEEATDAQESPSANGGQRHKRGGS